VTLELLDSLFLPGDPAKPNDDAFAHFARAAVVMDGATSLGDPLMPGKSDAAWIAHFGARRLMAHLQDGDAPADALTHALADAEKSFKALARRAPSERYEIPYAAMMLAVEKAGGIEALWFGDCACLLKRPGEMTALIGEALDKKQAERNRAARLASAKGVAPAASVNLAAFLPALRKARNRLNTQGGGWAFAPDPAAAPHVSRAAFAAPPGTLLLLASDGFLALVSDYNCHDAESLLAAAEAKGLAALGAELRAVEAGDPSGEKFPRFKTSDDATALLLRVG